MGHNGSPEEFWGGAHKCLFRRPKAFLLRVNISPHHVRAKRGRIVTPFHVKPERQTFMLWVCLLTLALMTSLTMWLTNSRPTYDQPSSAGPAQVPHFVCTADGDGTIMRCVFSTIAPQQN